MRRWLSFTVAGARCAATLDEAPGAHGLLIVSGGNELRCGAHRGMAALAARIAAAGYPVLRFDRRGVGDSEGENDGFVSSAADIAAALALFRSACPTLTRITAFGNCDAATALVLHHGAEHADALILANPWLIDAPGDADSSLPLPAAIRARYAARLRNPREWLRLLRGGVDLRKLWHGLRAASVPTPASALTKRLADAMAAIGQPLTILIAERDATAMAFAAAWQTPAFAPARGAARLRSIDSASHSFADDVSREWLFQCVLAGLSA